MNTGFLSMDTPLACPLTAARRVSKGGSEVVALGGSPPIIPPLRSLTKSRIFLILNTSSLSTDRVQTLSAYKTRARSFCDPHPSFIGNAVNWLGWILFSRGTDKSFVLNLLENGR